MKKVFRHILLLLLCTVFIFCAALPAVAAPSKQTVRVGYVDIENFIESADAGGYFGFGAEYLDRICDYTGWEYTCVKGSWTECLERLKNGEIDLLMPAEKTAQREREYLFSDLPCCMDYTALITRSSEDDIYYNDFEAFDGMRIGMISGNYLNFSFAQYAEENGFSYTPVYYDNYNDMSQALEESDCDAIVMGNLVTLSGRKIVARFNTVPAYFITTNSNSALMAELNDALFHIELEDPDFLEVLIEKFYENSAIAEQFTREETEYIKALPSIKIVADSHNEPFEWFDADSGKYCGINVDIIKKLCSISGVELDYTYTDTLYDAWEMVKNGQADIISGVYLNDELCNKYELKATRQYCEENSFAVCRNDHPVFTGDSLTVAVSSSFIGMREYLEKAYPQWTIVAEDSFDDCLRAVEKREADITFITFYSIQTDPLLTKFPDLNIVSNISVSLPLYIGVGKSAPENLDLLFSKAITQLTDLDLQRAVVNNTARSRSGFSLEYVLHYHPVQTILIIVAIIILVAVAITTVCLSGIKSKQAKALEESNLRLIYADKAKSDFLSRMSHDIRTPMNGIIGLTELNLDRDIPDDLRRDLEKIDSSSKFLLGLVNDILDMTKIESDLITLNPVVYPIDKLKNYIHSVFEPLCEQKSIKLITDFGGLDNDAIQVDEVRFNQIFFNLLSNAAKFTPAGGKVTFAITNVIRHDGLIDTDIVVSDTGIGMSEEFQKHMYEAFVRENQELSDGIPGSGMGLAIVRQLVGLMNGKISADSKKGEGTTFTVHLSLPTANSVVRQPEPPHDMKKLKGKRILLCEDQPINREIVQRLLSKKGVVVDMAENGLKGLEKFIASPIGTYDAILMDIRMPVMDGLEAASRIRDLGRSDSRSIPIIAMTANAFDDDREASHTAGMDAHLAKPVVPQLLYNTLSEYIQ